MHDSPAVTSGRRRGWLCAVALALVVGACDSPTGPGEGPPLSVAPEVFTLWKAGYDDVKARVLPAVQNRTLASELESTLDRLHQALVDRRLVPYNRATNEAWALLTQHSGSPDRAELGAIMLVLDGAALAANQPLRPFANIILDTQE